MTDDSRAALKVKLEISSGNDVALVGAPDGFTDALGELPKNVVIRTELRGRSPFDIIILFVKSEQELTRRLTPLRGRLMPHGSLWVAWPHRASKVKTDLNSDKVIDVMQAGDYADRKHCPFDIKWDAIAFSTGR
jgi:hypothetical protein